MAGLTLAQCEAELAIWMAADQAVAAGQQWQHQGRTYTKVDAGEIRRNINYWDAKCQRLDRQGPRVRGVVNL